MTSLLKITFFFNKIIKLNWYLNFCSILIFFIFFFSINFLFFFDLNSDYLFCFFLWFFSSNFFFLNLDFFSFNFLSTEYTNLNNSLNFFFNPQADIDSSVSTDSDDLIVFIADIFEFTEHEQALLLDTLTDSLSSLLFLGFGGISSSLSIRSLKK